MATTAKQSSSSSVRGSSSSSTSTTQSSTAASIQKSSSLSPGKNRSAVNEGSEEDIETIAKQISDHAEAIYQTWKARGLAPTEILNCHSVNSDAFGKTLTPPQRNKESPVNELLSQSPNMSNNNLKKLVSSFVNEDKARQQTAVARKSNILTSGTIKDALRKFESVDTSTNAKPNFLKYSNSSNTKSTLVGQQPQTQQQQSALLQNNSYGHTNRINNKNVPDVLLNTIEQVKTIAVDKTEVPVTRVKPETPAKPASLLNHTPSWPLKNRIAVVENGGSKLNSTTSSSSSPITTSTTTTTSIAPKTKQIEIKLSRGNDTNHKTSTPKKPVDKPNKLSNLMDEVLMEEERLINALKTGTVLNNDTPLPEVITSTLASDKNSTEVRNWAANSDDLAHPKSAAMVISQHHPTSDAQESVLQMKFSLKPRPKNDAAVPHPEISANTTKLNAATNARNATTPAVRPFLTRGSVAERVLMFEKCPEIKKLRNAPKDPSKLTVSYHIFFLYRISELTVIIFVYGDLNLRAAA